ncbi:MAG: L-lactate dehydrogenase [Candidatus Omnitrophica bacterium]|nr:L-lactate dehydrogenase [Candidatus Omnitrophota bacterium]
MKNSGSKVVIIGAGNVGSTFAFSLMKSGLAREIVLIDRDEKRAQGECMDLNHGAAFLPPVKIYPAGYEGCKGADVVVITAGSKQKPGESRLDLLQRNAGIVKEIVGSIVRHTKDAILLVVTNPVDIISYVTMKVSGFPNKKVIGSGTVLDTSRFRYLLSEHCRVDARNVHAYIIGEHGDTELPVWSNANIAGIKLSSYCPLCSRKGCSYKKDLHKIFEEVKNSAYRIIEFKGATYYAIALSLVKIVSAILRDENSVLPVSGYMENCYGFNDLYLSIPAIVNRNGIERQLEIELSKEEAAQLKASAQKLKSEIEKLKI